MVFTLPSNASQVLYAENTFTALRVELPECVVLLGNDYEVAFVSFIYPHAWLNVPDLVGQMHTDTFALHQGHPHCGTEAAMSEDASGSAKLPPELHPSQSTTLIKSQRTHNPSYYEHTRQILHDLNGHVGDHQTAFLFSYHSARNSIMVNIRPGLKTCKGWVRMM